MKTTSQNGIALIKRHEGLRLTAYKCPAGKWTIGWGHTRGVKEGMTITTAQAEEYMRQDLKDAESAVNRQLSGINQNQFDALISFVFNFGETRFAGSTLLARIKSGADEKEIRYQFSRWIYSDGKPSDGLRKRRNDEANLYFSK